MKLPVIRRVMPMNMRGEDFIGVAPMKPPCHEILEIVREQRMMKANLVEAFDKFAKSECTRLEAQGSSGIEAAVHLRELAEYAHLLDLTYLTQELHHEYVNS